MLKFKAFSLLETCFVLIIIGILTSVLVPLLKQTLSYKRRLDTQAKQETLMKILAQSNFVYPHQETFGSGGMKVGRVPTEALGIPSEWARDGYGYYFTYIFSQESMVLWESGKEVPVNVLLISHGPEGSGAFGEDGTRRPVGAGYSPDKARNAGEGGIYVKRPFSLKVGDKFDDLVYAGTKKGLQALYGTPSESSKNEGKRYAGPTLLKSS